MLHIFQKTQDTYEQQISEGVHFAAPKTVSSFLDQLGGEKATIQSYSIVSILNDMEDPLEDTMSLGAPSFLQSINRTTKHSNLLCFFVLHNRIQGKVEGVPHFPLLIKQTILWIVKSE